jgi:hypothetical protein
MGKTLMKIGLYLTIMHTYAKKTIKLNIKVNS